MENEKLKLGFKDDFNKSKTISVDYIKADLTPHEVKDAMEKIIASEVIETKEGKITKINKAYLETVKREDINLEEIQ